MVVEWSSSEKLRLLILSKNGVNWVEAADKMNEEYTERPLGHFNEKNCKAEFDRICSDACPRVINPDQPTQPFKKSAMIDAWIAYLKEQVKLDSEKMVEMGLVELRRDSDLVERLINGDRPSAAEMRSMLAIQEEEIKKTYRDAAQLERVLSAYRARFTQIFKERREAEGAVDVTAPVSVSISPTKASSVTLQQAFRSPSPIKSPIRPLAEAISEADAELLEAGVEEMKMEEEEEEGRRRSERHESTVSPRTAADRAIGDGGLEEEMEEEEEEEEEPLKEEPMEVDEAKVEEERKKQAQPAAARKSTRGAAAAEVAAPPTPPTTGGKKKKEAKETSPMSSADSTASRKSDKKEETEEEGRVRRTSMRGRPPGSAAAAAAEETAAHAAKAAEKKEEPATTTPRRSSRVEKIEEKKEEETPKRMTRQSMAGKEEEKEEKEATFVAPSSASRARLHRGSEHVDEKEKSEEPSVPKTRSGARPSLGGRGGETGAKGSPAPVERKRRGEKKEEEEMEAPRGRKESSLALSEKSLPGTGGKREVEVNTEVSIRHPVIPVLSSPSKTRRGTERESSGTPVARKSSRVSSASSTGKREAVMTSVQCQTDPVEMKGEDEVYISYDSNERYFHPVMEIERGGGRKSGGKKEKEIKEEEEEEKPISRRTRHGEAEEDGKTSRSNSFTLSEKGTPTRRKEGKREVMVHLEVDAETGRYLMKQGALAEDADETGGPSTSKKVRMGDLHGRRSMAFDPVKNALTRAVKDLELHRHSNTFKNKVDEAVAEGYYDTVHCPTYLTKIRTDINDGVIKDPIGLKRTLALMYLNCTMFNSTTLDVWYQGIDMFKETFSTVRQMVPELMPERDEEPTKVTRSRKNEPAFAKDATRVERDRSMISRDRLFKCESVETEEEKPNVQRSTFARSNVDSTRKRRI